MSDIKLFSIKHAPPIELKGKSVALEKSLQILIEAHLETFLGVHFLGTEYSTGKVHGGRIDTLGIDENGCPVIIEYKRSTNENVINQGLFYLSWLMDHKSEFELLVLNKLGQVISGSIQWRSPRVICIAGDFNKYDKHAVQQISKNIDLVRYRRYGDDLLLLELVNDVSVEPSDDRNAPQVAETAKEGPRPTAEDKLQGSSAELRDLFEAMKAFLMGLGDDVRLRPMPSYLAFVRMKNFAWVKFAPSMNLIVVAVAVDPDSVQLEDGFTRDLRHTGNVGRAHLEFSVRSMDEFEKAKPLLLKSYEAS